MVRGKLLQIDKNEKFKKKKILQFIKIDSDETNEQKTNEKKKILNKMI